jgi:hypothetical protein
MEMMIIAVVAIVAFAAVLIPLFRRRVPGADTNEFEGDTGAAAQPAQRESKRAARDAAQADGPTPAEDIAPPMAAGPVSLVDAAAVPAGTPADAATADELELEVQRYRAALRAGTVCNKCGQANPAESRFCFDCGAPLPLAEAREFE